MPNAESAIDPSAEVSDTDALQFIVPNAAQNFLNHWPRLAGGTIPFIRRYSTS